MSNDRQSDAYAKKKSAEKKHQFNEFSVNILFCAPITRQWQQLKLPAKTTKTTKTSEPNNEWQESSVQIDFVCIIYWLALVFLLYTRIEGNEIRIRNSLRVSLHWFFVHNARWENGAVFGSVNDNNAYIKRLAFIKYFEMKQPIFHFISFQFRFQPDFWFHIWMEWKFRVFLAHLWLHKVMRMCSVKLLTTWFAFEIFAKPHICHYDEFDDHILHLNNKHTHTHRHRHKGARHWVQKETHPPAFISICHCLRGERWCWIGGIFAHALLNEKQWKIQFFPHSHLWTFVNFQMIRH